MIFPQEHIFPTKKDENWKYTSLKSWLEKPYTLADSKGVMPQLDSAFHYKAIFVNGCFKEALSKLPASVTVSTENTKQNGPQDSLVMLNARYSSKTTVIHIKPGSQVPPLQIVFVTSTEVSPTMNYPQTRLEIGEGSQTQILTEYKNNSDEVEAFVSSWMEVVVHPYANVEFVSLQNQNIKSFHYEKLNFALNKQANLKVLTVAIGGQLSRSEVGLDVLDSEISAQLLGVYAINGTQQSDHYTTVNHKVGGSQTNQLYKGLLDGKSKAVFNGKVVIAANAQKANSEQLNKNLLLSPDAEVNSKPELEIYADDVKATHGSTIGQIQKEEVFYLQTRGIKKEKAIQMVSEAFVMDVVHQLENSELKKAVKFALQAKGAVK